MLSPPVIENEDDRLTAVRSLRVLDTPAEAAFDELVELAAWTCHVPIAALSLIDTDRQWFKSSIGLDITETEREVAFCAHTIGGDQTMIIPDAKLDPRFSENPFVTGDAEIRFYAGVPIIVDELPVGTLCVLDTRPRSMFAGERRALEILARQAGGQLAAVRLEWEAVDALTGVSAMIAARRWLRDQPTDRPRAAVHVDIDGLGAINAARGDAAGDRVLAATAARLRDAAPDGSLIARVGGDEFVVLLERVEQDALAIAVDDLLLSLEADDQSADLSMGLATASSGESGADLIEAAARATALEKELRRTE